MKILTYFSIEIWFFDTQNTLHLIVRGLKGCVLSATPYFVSFATSLLYLLPPHICIICHPIFVSFATQFWKFEICIHCGALRGGRHGDGHGGRHGGRQGGQKKLKNLNVYTSWRVGRQYDWWGHQGDDGGRAGRRKGYPGWSMRSTMWCRSRVRVSQVPQPRKQSISMVHYWVRHAKCTWSSFEFLCISLHFLPFSTLICISHAIFCISLHFFEFLTHFSAFLWFSHAFLCISLYFSAFL